MLNKEFWDRVGADVVNRYRKQIFDEAKDVFGNNYPEYSEKYGRKKRANKFKRQASDFSGSKAPVLTGDLYRSFKMRGKPDNTGFTFGTTVWGGKVKDLQKLGRVISTEEQPIPQADIDWLLLKAKNYTQERLKKMFKKAIGKGIDIKL